MIKDFTHFRDTLQDLPFFNRLTAETQCAISVSASHHHYAAGQVVYLDGEPAAKVFILEKGWVKATRMTRDGREQAMLFLRPVEVFGDIPLFPEIHESNDELESTEYAPHSLFFGTNS